MEWNTTLRDLSYIMYSKAIVIQIDCPIGYVRDQGESQMYPKVSVFD